MQRKHGYWWPDADRVAADAVIRDAASHFPRVFRYMKRFGTAVQAGGNVGVYPRMLAEGFDQVLTFEPDGENHACLRENLCYTRNVRDYHAALGESIGMGTIERPLPDNIGAHRLGPGAERVQVYTIDSLNLPSLDLIWLDVEGYEPEVLRGAAVTIGRCRPIVIVEDKGLEAGGQDATRRQLEAGGYEMAARIRRDYVMVPR